VSDLGLLAGEDNRGRAGRCRVGATDEGVADHVLRIRVTETFAAQLGNYATGCLFVANMILLRNLFS
jgi:hypothetical protein